jgi:endogenous inhibitor of DNA gyrase (YacG/DUF329 family)
MTSVRVCVYCRERPVVERWRPFCSERCKLLDLAAWAKGTYRIPGAPVPAPETPEPGDEDH